MNYLSTHTTSWQRSGVASSLALWLSGLVQLYFPLFPQPGPGLLWCPDKAQGPFTQSSSW